jgi:hypothetical protein
MGACLVATKEFPRLSVVAVGPYSLYVEIVTEESGLELVVLRRGPEGDADDFLHEKLQR